MVFRIPSELSNHVTWEVHIRNLLGGKIADFRPFFNVSTQSPVSGEVVPVREVAGTQQDDGGVDEGTVSLLPRGQVSRGQGRVLFGVTPARDVHQSGWRNKSGVGGRGRGRGEVSIISRRIDS